MNTRSDRCGSGVLFRWEEGERTAVITARAVLGAALAALRFSEDEIEGAVLMVGELVANAVEHARGPYALVLRRMAGEFICEVYDRSSQLPEPPDAARPFEAHEMDRGGGLEALSTALATRGRGLQIVHHLSAGNWGVRRTPAGKCCWFALPNGASGVSEGEV
ncbi:ATP-binding protein [Streptomyces platensis]|uniref:ATP-binding protein n=1 Tax=Streptomyces platensis TaxID=58346 RepID=UPI002E11BA62|nr:ATP-binding protein [Streptomyces platensis]WTI50733.1 ATP-binding protein [Streptomyces platensis]WUB83713.1 ATP-binding protein [Streptomyces platensis]